jgi:hypothetical protein
MPELVKENLSFKSLAVESGTARSSSKERYLFLALASLLTVNVVVVFAALTFYYLLVQR